MSKKSVKMENFRYKFASPGCAPLAGKESAIVMLWLVCLSHASERDTFAPSWKAPLKGFRSIPHRHPNLVCGYHVTNYVSWLNTTQNTPFFSQLQATLRFGCFFLTLWLRASISNWCSALAELWKWIHFGFGWVGKIIVASVTQTYPIALCSVRKTETPFAHSWFGALYPSKD